MALLLFSRMESDTLDGTHDFTAGDGTWATVAGSPAFNTDAALYGTNGLDCPGHSTNVGLTVSSEDIINQGVGAVGFWFRMAGFINGAILFIARNSGTPNNQIQIEMLGTDDATGRELRLRIRLSGVTNVTLDTTAADLQLNEWYFVLFRYDEPNSDRRMEIYNDDLSLRTSVEDLTTNFDEPTGIDTLLVGNITTGSGLDTHFDNLFIADAYAEPIEDFLDITSYTEYGVSGNPATKVVFTTQPANTVVGETMSAVVVEAKDDGDVTDTDFTDNITLALQTGSGTLAGTLVKAAVAGVATFDDLSINTLNTGAVLRATASGLTLADSSSFNITAGGGSGARGSPFRGPF